MLLLTSIPVEKCIGATDSFGEAGFMLPMHLLIHTPGISKLKAIPVKYW